MNEPGGLSIAAGKMYIADTNNHRIQVIDMQTREVSTLQLQGVDAVRRDEVGERGGEEMSVEFEIACR